MLTLLVALFALALVYAIAGVLSIYYGWVLSILWGWFIVPLGVRPLSVVHAIGFTMVVGMCLTGISRVSLEGETGKKTALGLLIGPLITLLFGYIAHCFM